MSNTNQNRHTKLLALVECAVMVALAVALDLLPLPKWPNGGSLSLSCIPIIYISYRRGIGWGVASGFVNAIVQILMNWYAPPAGTLAAVTACILLDYLLAYSVAGTAPFFAGIIKKNKLVGYIFGAVAVNIIRFLSSFLSGIILWASYAPEGQPVWLYSLGYNAGYMLPNAVIAGICIAALCSIVSPVTLRPMKKS